MKIKLLLLIVLCAALGGSAFGQGLRFENTVTQQGTIGAVTNALVIPAGAQIAWCSFPANAVPCTNKATTYTSNTLGTPCATSTQIVLVGTTACVASPDSQENWGVWAPAGSYAYTIALPGGINLGPYNVTLGISSGISLSIAGLTTTGPNTLAGTSTLGSVSATGTATFPDLNGGKYVDGTKYATLAAAFAACPGTGCVIDLQGNPAITALGTFDPSTTPVKLLLGPYNYTAVQFTLRFGFVMLGQSSGVTKITSVGSNATPLFVIPQTINQAAQEVYLRGMQLIGAAGNTSQDGIFADASTSTNAGLWYSVFEDLFFTNWKGVAMHFKGPSSGAAALNQFNQFRNCIVLGPSGRTSSLRIEGGNNQFEFYGGEFDGSGLADGGTNIYIGATGATANQPLTINFHGVTVQSASVGVNLNGVNQVSFDGTHMEALSGGFNVTFPGAGVRNNGITISNTYFAGTVGVNAGIGYLLNVGSNFANVVFKHNMIGGTPDKVAAGSNLNTVSLSDNFFTANSPYPFTSSNIATLLAPAAAIDTGGSHAVILQASGTVISTINSMLGVGESITFRANGSTVSFGTGGNIYLGSNASPIILSVGDTATFTREDGAQVWDLVGYSRGTNALPAGTTIGGVAFPATVASGTTALGTGAIAATNCAGSATTAATGVVSTDTIIWSPNLGGTGGYTAALGSGLVVYAVPTANNVNFFVCNPTAASITPSASTVNWRVLR